MRHERAAYVTALFILFRCGDCMKPVIHLPKDDKVPTPKRKKKKKKEHINWHDLMGMNRDTYKRGPGGAIRRR